MVLALPFSVFTTAQHGLASFIASWIRSQHYFLGALHLDSF